MGWLGKRGFLILLATVAVSAPAIAIEQDYVTNNGITQLSAAFRYIALFFSNDDYGGLVYVAAVIGFVVSALISVRHGNKDDRTMGNWLLAFGISVGLYTAFIIPKGTIHIYDKTLNAYEPVSGVPDGIIIIAGLTNTIEQVAVEIANTVSLTPYENTAGGIVFELIRATFKSERPIDDEYLWENLKSYYIECGQVAAVIPGSGFNMNELNRRSANLLTTFANAQSSAVSIVYKTEANPVGTLTTCTDAFTQIQAELNDPTTFTSMIDGMCSSVGFDTSNAAQLSQCQSIMDDIIPNIFEQTGDRLTYLQSAAIAMAIQDAAADLNPERAIAQETNRRFIIQGVGLFSFAQEYGPAIRAGFLAAALTTLVVTTLFLLTPWRNRAFALSIGFFVFVAVWGIIDIGLQVVVEEIALDAFEEVKRNRLAFDAFMLTPPASVKALSVFGASRLISITLASTIVVTIFRLSGASFGQLTGTLARHGEDVGGRAAESRLDPEQLAAGTRARADTVGSFRGMASEGEGAFAGIAEAAQGRLVDDLARHGAFVSGGHTMGLNMNEAYRLSGAVAGGSQSGRVEGFARRSDTKKAGVAAAAHNQSATSMERSVLDASEYEQAATDLAANIGVSVPEAKSLIEGYGHALSTGKITGAEGDLERVFNSASLEEQQRIGAATGISLAATRENMTPGQIAQADSFMDTLFKSGEARFASNADAQTLDRVARAGEVRRERQVGEVEGLERAAVIRDSNYGDLSRQAAAIGAADQVLGADRVAAFAESHGISPEDVLFSRGSNYELGINDRTMQAFGDLLTPGQLDVARPGASMSMSFDPYTGEIGNIDVRSGFSARSDSTTNIQDGYRVDGQQGPVGGRTIFRFADMLEAGNYSGAAKIADVYSNAQEDGSVRALGDSLAQDMSGYFSSIAGKQLSYFSSDSTTGGFEAFAGYEGSFGLKLLGNGHTAKMGAKGTWSFADVDSEQIRNSYDFWNDRVQDLYARTLGNAEFKGDNIEKSSAFLSGIMDLRQEAHDIREWVKSREYDDKQSQYEGESTSDVDIGNTAKQSYVHWPKGFRPH